MTAERTGTLASTDLVVGGMTCAACVNRVEKRLARIEGVSATVNLATGRARVSHPAAVTVGDLLAAVERAGLQRGTARSAPARASAAAECVGSGGITGVRRRS